MQGSFYFRVMFTVYALVSLSRNYIYVGLTGDLTRRLREHEAGYNQSTRAYRPFLLFFQEDFPSRVDARIREKYLKSATGKRFLRSIIPPDTSSLNLW